MVNRNLIIVLVIVVVLAIATFLFGGGLNFGEGEAPEVLMARQAQQAAGTVPPPAAEVAEEVPSPAAAPEPAEEAAEPPTAAAEPGAEAEPAAEAAEEPPAGEAAAGAEVGEEAAEATGEQAAVEPEAEEEAAEDAAAEGAEEEPAAGAEAEAAADEAEEEVVGDPVENFKALDPRDIILEKYKDLDERTTEPWDEMNPETYMPNTGRVDPLTRVFGSVPDELKPPRAGETDMNAISTYLIANAATQIVNSLALQIQCHNVIQIGLEEYATFSFGENMFTLQEDQSTGGQVGYVEGIPIILTVSCTSISTSEVVLNLAVTGYGTPTRIEKNQIYIPRNRY
jgi:hypothetical protein